MDDSGPGADSDPADLADLSVEIARLTDATDRLLDTVRDLDDDTARGPSLCAGWTRGHVLTHLARNADGMANLVAWARDGQERAMYASRAARERDIEAGAGRTASELEADVEASAERFLDALVDFPSARLSAEVLSGPLDADRRPVLTMHGVLWHRLREVEFHHVDLNLGYTFGNTPDVVLDLALAESVRRLQDRPGAPGFRLVATDASTPGDGTWTVGGGEPAVRGPRHALLAWLTGRCGDPPAGVQADGPLPALGSWG